jgi:hypothetical protein
MSTYRYRNIHDGHYYYTNELPEEPEKHDMMPDSVGVNIGVIDLNYQPLYTGDIIKHYLDDKCPDAYDIGIIFSDGKDKYYRTTTILGYDRFNLSDKCKYLKLGDTSENSATIAARLWTTLSYDQKMRYFMDTGIIGFLEDFELPRKNGEMETLTTEEIQYALDMIENYTTID